MLQSLVCPVDLYDLIILKKRRDGLICVEMHGFGTELMPPEQNNACRAAGLYAKTYKTCGADITIYKNIPLGAGLGGSSADAAGVLLGMSKLYGKGSERELKELADSLGSDTGYMLTGGYALLTGRGERIQKIHSNTRLDFLLLKPTGGVSTAECYKLYDALPTPPQDPQNAIQALISGDKETLGKCLHNALYAPAAQLNQDVCTAYGELQSFSPLGVNMTGSGSAVFALFPSAEFCGWAKSRYRGKFQCYQLKTVLNKE